MRILATILSLILVVESGLAFELPESRIHKAMQATFYDDNWKDGEGETNAVTQGTETAPIADHPTGRKSIIKSGLLSALVPGGGQYYTGRKRTAAYFFAAEVFTWIGFAAFRTYGNQREDDYIRYAKVHANAQLDGKSDEFADLVGFYDNIRDYNALGRAWDPDRPYLQDTPDNHWEWQTFEEQRTYRDLKNASREAYRRADFMIGVAVVNRIISIIDAVRGTARLNRRIGTDFSLDDSRRLKLSVNPFSSRRQVSIKFYPGF